MPPCAHLGIVIWAQMHCRDLHAPEGEFTIPSRMDFVGDYRAHARTVGNTILASLVAIQSKRVFVVCGGGGTITLVAENGAPARS